MALSEYWKQLEKIFRFLGNENELSSSTVRSFTDLQLNFEYFYANGRDALMQYSPPLMKGTYNYLLFIMSMYFLLLLFFWWQIINFVFYSSLPARKRVVYTSLVSWCSNLLQIGWTMISREKCFRNLLYCVNWDNVDAAFIVSLLEEDQLYQNSRDAILSLLSMAESNCIYLGQRFHDHYQSLQDSYLPRTRIWWAQWQQ